MRIETPPILGRAWRALTDVPGWPDAPPAVRVRRLWPMLLPCAGLVVLAGWNWGVQAPRERAVREDHAAILELEAAISDLRMQCSDRQAATLAVETEKAAAMLLPSVEHVAPYLRQVHEQIRALGWEAVFQAYDAPVDDPRAGAPLRLIGVRCQLTPIPGNPEPFAGLVKVLGIFSGPDRRIDLTRLGVRVDESEKLAVDLNLRLGCRAQHEKTPQ